jgi:hypothetical protein
MITPWNALLAAYDEGAPALLPYGRSIYDSIVDPEDKKIRTIEEGMRRAMYRRGLLLVKFSKAGGLDYYKDTDLLTESDRKLLEQFLKTAGLLGLPPDDQDTPKVLRRLLMLARTTTDDAKLSNGQPLRFAILLEFTEHLAPGGLMNGTQTEDQLQVIESIYLFSHDLAPRRTGHLVAFHSNDGGLDPLVTAGLRKVPWAQPTADEKREYVGAARALFTKAAFAEGVTDDVVANLTAKTPNRGLETVMRAAHRTGSIITIETLKEVKRKDIEQISEGTLFPLDGGESATLELKGRNVQKPLQILGRIAEKLRAGERDTPLNILLAGAPGTGKTTLAMFLGANAHVPILQMVSPKDGIVGGTEKKVRLQWEILNTWGGGVIAFIDEINETLTLQRSSFNGDSGASNAVLASFLTELSNESKRGERLLIGTTNTPFGMSAAILDRFVVIVVPPPSAGDYPAIIAALARRIDPAANIDEDAEQVLVAARIFHERGATARHMRSQLSSAKLLSSRLTPDTVLFAAKDFRGTADPLSAAFAELTAIRACSSSYLLPWTRDVINPTTGHITGVEMDPAYSLPSYLDGVVDRATGDVDSTELEKRIQEMRPHANV